MSEPQGCLTVLLGLLGIRLPASEGSAGSTAALPYRVRDDFLSAAELSFYQVLRQVVADRAVICPKVNLSDVLFVAQSKSRQSYRNKIDRKHLDFVLCEPATMQVLCAVELDDASHRRDDRMLT